MSKEIKTYAGNRVVVVVVFSDKYATQSGLKIQLSRFVDLKRDGSREILSYTIIGDET